MDFHELGFNGQLAGENNQKFWFMLSSREHQQATPPWGPGNPQELNRFSYVKNSLIVYDDPSGHQSEAISNSSDIGGYATICKSRRGDTVICGEQGTDISNAIRNSDGDVLLQLWMTYDGKKHYLTRWNDADDDDLEAFKKGIDMRAANSTSNWALLGGTVGVVTGMGAILICAGPQIVGSAIVGALGVIGGGVAFGSEYSKTGPRRDAYFRSRNSFHLMSTGKGYHQSYRGTKASRNSMV